MTDTGRVMWGENVLALDLAPRDPRMTGSAQKKPQLSEDLAGWPAAITDSSDLTALPVPGVVCYDVSNSQADRRGAAAGNPLHGTPQASGCAGPQLRKGKGTRYGRSMGRRARRDQRNSERHDPAVAAHVAVESARTAMRSLRSGVRRSSRGQVSHG